MRIIGANAYSDSGVAYSVSDAALLSARSGSSRNEELVQVCEHVSSGQPGAFSVYIESPSLVYIGPIMESAGRVIMRGRVMPARNMQQNSCFCT